jgi:acyl carrier protein
MQQERGTASGGDAEIVRRFLAERFLFDPESPIDARASLLGEGVLDSTGAMELVLFLEESFGVTVEDEDLVPENLDSIERVVTFVARKRFGSGNPAALDALEGEGARASSR